jgi:hypothetical protein
MHNATMNYRILTHEILHVLLLEEPAEGKVPFDPEHPDVQNANPEYIIYGDFRYDDPSCTVILSDYKWIRQSAQDFSVPFPENYDAFS